ncbi:DUF221-domain-containing protein [Pseudovirgaria hyperparasitica]|uniref:DUF221-domain-containing protein n=1 Tax=Pseudovirgaria hyperparasitica TaxID=470096 RepID=A0A6A6WBW0_9PEZI|nr:DUF221-domain-containing protein [Pseudovirgaria hyperparasitica]KAF2759326.1 DUF221-domain-containing protein [Pseudovirgaria hyperparasitica]
MHDICKDVDPDQDLWGTKKPRDATIQIILSLALGFTAFLSFCVMRPRWKTLYAARKKQNDQATSLPELPDSLFGWIPALWRITEEEVLASAGLDAYVFLAFFKMAIKFLVITLFFAVAVIKPVHDVNPDEDHPPKKNETGNNNSIEHTGLHRRGEGYFHTLDSYTGEYTSDYLWMYLVFAYGFTVLAMWLIVAETRKIIDIRQKYLGSQTTITDRTIRLSGIPPEYRSEAKIKEFIENLEIGQVESVTLCKNWKELDKTMIERMSTLRRLEEAWTVYLGHRRIERNLETLPISQPPPPGPSIEVQEDGEHSHLLHDSVPRNSRAVPYGRTRPLAKIWYGRPLKLRYRNVDAIDYYEQTLHRLDEEIRDLRKKEFEATPLAFVTMDSVASCQMAVQAVLDPAPLRFTANTSPAPSDVVWQNTYLPRSKRMTRAWSITGIIGLLTVFWIGILVPIAGSLNTCSIKAVWPQLAKILTEHEYLSSIVNTQLPTLFLSLLNVLVPYLYDWLSNMQGMISQGDVELSLISKNFFFLFFNFFIVFTLLGTASGLIDFLQRFGDQLRKGTEIARLIADSLRKLLNFYTNFIILQGLGLFPFRILEFGAVATYPISLMGAKTPRDYAELVQPPVFSYGFYLPQTILIFIICVVYSVLRSSWMVLLAGLVYFTIGHFVHKYQLLYAMDHRQHSTGRGWILICDRAMVGVLVFQITMAGQLALRQAWKRSVCIVPLIFATLWFMYLYNRTYQPLMRFIALKSLKDSITPSVGRDTRESEHLPGLETVLTGGSQTVDEAREKGLKFINPSLIMPLDDVWIADKTARVFGDFSGISNGVDN